MTSKSRKVFAGVACGVAALWLWRVLPALAKLPRVSDLLDSKYAEDLEHWPSVTVIVPAKDEAEAIQASLQSLLANDYPNLRVVAVDDRSTDATGALMEQLATAPGTRGRLSVLHVKELPAGWMGKPHAMALAAESAETDWLLFTDADVIFAPDALRRAIAFAEMSGADHCVVYPTLILKRWTERMLIAFFQSVSALGGRPWKVSDPEARRDYIGVGAFNMI
jgi:cellulose synthase/poly-beta-1,6-N-acetylglucosamine synthase-like glycosyltransferase